MSAARISHGWLASPCWNARAVPWNEPCTPLGTPSLAIASSIATCACDSDTPSGKLNEIVDAANCPWWLTASGVLVGPQCANAVSGTDLPSDVCTYVCASASGLCQYSGATSITTLYWLSGL